MDFGVLDRKEKSERWGDDGSVFSFCFSILTSISNMRF